jgi:hypothetical protein
MMYNFRDTCNVDNKSGWRDTSEQDVEVYAIDSGGIQKAVNTCKLEASNA